MFEELEQMLEQKRFSELKKEMAKMEPADIVIFFENLEREDAVRVFRILPKELAAETFADMDHDMQEDLIESFSASELSEILDEMYLDDTVDV
ncbi:MAG: magnesium transporter, partial [Clostridia bacterium]|nr:magnesium transporter [Clostridia bacterium]